jgi:hypothetical protein
VDGRWRAALRGAPYDVEHRIVVGGAVKWVRERAELTFDGEGRLVGAVGAVQDITERRLAEEARREDQDRLARARGRESAVFGRRNAWLSSSRRRAGVSSIVDQLGSPSRYLGIQERQLPSWGDRRYHGAPRGCNGLSGWPLHLLTDFGTVACRQ